MIKFHQACQIAPTEHFIMALHLNTDSKAVSGITSVKQNDKETNNYTSLALHRSIN
jgi:hypothetical protein